MIYHEYCKANSLKCEPGSTLFKRLEYCKLEVKTLNGYEVYRGISIIDIAYMEDFNEVVEKEKLEPESESERLRIQNQLTKVNSS